jgi:hypothetical protein
MATKVKYSHCVWFFVLDLVATNFHFFNLSRPTFLLPTGHNPVPSPTLILNASNLPLLGYDAIVVALPNAHDHLIPSWYFGLFQVSLLLAFGA